MLVAISAIIAVMAACRRPPNTRVLRVGDAGDYDFGDLALVSAHEDLAARAMTFA